MFSRSLKTTKLWLIRVTSFSISYTDDLRVKWIFRFKFRLGKASYAISSLLGGPTFANFWLALFNPWANTFGVWVGVICGHMVALWVYFCQKMYPVNPKFTKAFSTKVIGCEGNFECYENSDHRWCQSEGDLDYESIPDIFALSYLYLGTIGFLTTIFIGSGTVSRSTLKSSFRRKIRISSDQGWPIGLDESRE